MRPLLLFLSIVRCVNRERKRRFVGDKPGKFERIVGVKLLIVVCGIIYSVLLIVLLENITK